MTNELIQPEPKRDRWGRYLLPDPGTPGATSTLPWTRATTFAKSISDTFGLAKWQARMAVKGVTMRPDLFALAASAPTDDKSTLDRVVEAAKEHAGTSAGANQGTALHAFTERLDRGEQVMVPPPWDADVAAYQAGLMAAGLTVDARHIERIVVVRELQVAGTLDRLATLPDGRLVVADLKTGKDLSYAWLEIAVQLALYAHADAMWDGVTGRYEPMPDVDRTTAVVMHLPVGKATCELWDVDLVAGWELAKVCETVRKSRTRKNLAQRRVPDLTRLIASAATEAELDTLWRTNQRRWTEAHSAAARDRINELTPA